MENKSSAKEIYQLELISLEQWDSIKEWSLCESAELELIKGAKWRTGYNGN